MNDKYRVPCKGCGILIRKYRATGLCGDCLKKRPRSSPRKFTAICWCCNKNKSEHRYIRCDECQTRVDNVEYAGYRAMIDGGYYGVYAE